MTIPRELAEFATGYGAGSFAVGRNRIINGAMEVWQRGTSFAYSAFGGAGFCADRFWFYNAGGATSGTIERSTDVPTGEGFMYSLFNNTNNNLPSGTNVELTAQGNAAPFVVGNTYTLSFWVKGSSATSSINIQIDWRNSHANGSNSTPAVAAYPTFDVTTSWVRVVKTFTLNAAPHANNLVLDFEYTHPSGAKITGVQLEAGSVATPFERRSYGQELALCQRYYERVYINNSMPITIIHCYNTSTGYGVYAFKVDKRSSPTGVTSGNFIALTAGGASAGGSLSFDSMSVSAARLQLGGATGLAAGNASSVWGDTDPMIAFSSEL